MTHTLSPYSLFFNSGLHYHPIEDETDDENHPHSPILESPMPYTKTGLRSPIPRKRRSSITNAVSPVSAIKLKSPTRAAGNAWHVAHNAAVNSPRSRSGSLNVASEESSMVGRIRSGSLSNRLRTRKPLTSKRPIALLFAPTQPPPNAPLPQVPLSAPARPPLTRLTIQPQPILPDADVFYSAPAGPVSPTPSSPSAEFYHGPGMWRGFGAIEEEMRDD
ncbi:hypothetical protein MIND_00316900 [Mycena indigotica]|uniref:Uncharacterized protein n=1 Tax=Mycena indigotica TaxID=2126181 RepID=A0A8H6T399_9AGAR|nr:uncharacterized protein MIND_00316900 [Mycena indigotica]KAF7309461.1 hypothetical protein MIND_00316900 [Mycena indigotica]